MENNLLHNDIEYRFVKVPNFLNGFCCKLCAFNHDINDKNYCGNIPGSGCCYPFGKDEYYGFWKKVK